MNNAIPDNDAPAKRQTKRVSRSITHYAFLDSLVGRLLLAGNADALMLINFPTGNQAQTPHPDWILDDTIFTESMRQLRQYFAGERTEFSIPLEMDGTDFQIRVWNALREVPFGATESYGDIARRIGQPNASRAIGGANHANPLPIVVPCHRIIGADRSLTGFGGGVETKLKLLEFENPGKFSHNTQPDLFANT